MNRFFKAFICFISMAVSNAMYTQAATVTHDISTGTLIIPGNSTDDYIITGATTTNYVVVETGYHGVITLRNVNISLSGYNSPISIKGENDRSNLTPITNVDIILEGENFLSVGDGTCKWRREYCNPPQRNTIRRDEQTGLWYGESCTWDEPNNEWSCSETPYDEYYEENCYWSDWDGYVCYKQSFKDGCWEYWWLYEWSDDWEYSKNCLEERITYYDSDCGWVYYLDECEGCEEGIWGVGFSTGTAAFHVEQGAQINISAINPSDNTSGKLSAIVTTEDGGAGIGALNRGNNGNEAIAYTEIIGGCEPEVTAGGNIVISSGTVIAQGGHGAGIGGGYRSYYDGMIVIYGGDVTASSIRHSAGIGSGCPLSRGVETSCYTPNSAIIVLPPAQITATGSHETNEPRPDLALAGANIIIYVGDPEKPVITVQTEDFEPYADIYVDLSENEHVKEVIQAVVLEDRLDIHKIKFGQTGSNGIYQFHGIFEDYTTFFTDAVSSTPATSGRPYRPKTVLLPDGDGVDRTIILELMAMDLSLEALASIPLCEYYPSSEALANAYRVKITYSDDLPMANVVFDLAIGMSSDFLPEGELKFYASDGITEIPIPTTLNKGDVIYVVFPLKTGKTPDTYADVFRMTGTWDNLLVDYIRQVITQNVDGLKVSAIASPADGGAVFVTGVYPCGENVTVSAMPNEIYDFINWTNGSTIVSTNANYTFTTTSDVTLVANFEIKSYTVNLLANPTGSGDLSGGGDYVHGDEVTISATPDTGYNFLNWTDGGTIVSIDASYQFTVTGDVTLTANFELKTYDITVSAQPAEGGTVSGGGTGINHGTKVSVNAFPNTGYDFINWTNGSTIVSTDAGYTFEATGNVTLVANFALKTYTVSVIETPTGSGVLSGGGSYTHGANVTVSATANIGYTFDYWAEDGANISDNASYTFTATESRSLIANFVSVYDIIVSANPLEGGTASGGGYNISHGTSVTVSAIANEGYDFVNWTVHDVEVSTNASYKFTVTETYTVVANFSIKTYDIDVLASPQEGGKVAGGSNKIPHGTSITVSAIANEGYSFVNWIINGVIVSTDADFTLTATESCTLVANFIEFYSVNVDVNNDEYGYATGTGNYQRESIVQVEAFVNSCYRFANWTINNVVVSVENPYVFTVTEDVSLVANFYALDFDTYAHTLWDNTLMLDLKKLAEEGYELTGCKWFKNGIEEEETGTVSEYSYSAGSEISSKLEVETCYMFQLITENYGTLCSTQKFIILSTITSTKESTVSNLKVYPNPFPSGSRLTIEGVNKDNPIFVYNQAGSCVYSAVATGSDVTITLPVPEGVYLIRIGEKAIKIVVIN